MVVATVAVLMDVICKKIDSFEGDCSDFQTLKYCSRTNITGTKGNDGAVGGAPTGDLLKLLQDELDNLKSSDLREVKEVGLNLINALQLQPSTNTTGLTSISRTDADFCSQMNRKESHAESLSPSCIQSCVKPIGFRSSSDNSWGLFTHKLFIVAIAGVVIVALFHLFSAMMMSPRDLPLSSQSAVSHGLEPIAPIASQFYYHQPMFI